MPWQKRWTKLSAQQLQPTQWRPSSCKDPENSFSCCSCCCQCNCKEQERHFHSCCSPTAYDVTAAAASQSGGKGWKALSMGQCFSCIFDNSRGKNGKTFSGAFPRRLYKTNNHCPYTRPVAHVDEFWQWWKKWILAFGMGNTGQNSSQWSVHGWHSPENWSKRYLQVSAKVWESQEEQMTYLSILVCRANKSLLINGGRS